MLHFAVPSGGSVIAVRRFEAAVVSLRQFCEQLLIGGDEKSLSCFKFDRAIGSQESKCSMVAFRIEIVWSLSRSSEHGQMVAWGGLLVIPEQGLTVSSVKTLTVLPSNLQDLAAIHELPESG